MFPPARRRARSDIAANPLRAQDGQTRLTKRILSNLMVPWKDHCSAQAPMPSTSLNFGSATNRTLSTTNASLLSLVTGCRIATLPSYLHTVVPLAEIVILTPLMSASIPIILGSVPSIELYATLNRASLDASMTTCTLAPISLHSSVLPPVIEPIAAPADFAILSLTSILSVKPAQIPFRSLPPSSKLTLAPVIDAAPGFEIRRLLRASTGAVNSASATMDMPAATSRRLNLDISNTPSEWALNCKLRHAAKLRAVLCHTAVSPSQACSPNWMINNIEIGC